MTGEFPSQRASNAEIVSIWWCHHGNNLSDCTFHILLRSAIALHCMTKCWHISSPDTDGYNDKCNRLSSWVSAFGETCIKPCMHNELIIVSLQFHISQVTLALIIMINHIFIVDICNKRWGQIYLQLGTLTHCGLVTPYGKRYLNQHWLRYWLVAWRHQAITWTNVDWSSVKSNDIDISAISLEMPQPSITKICLKITCLKFHSSFQGANELNQ